ncbi:chromophore lyase CpcT/CpeT [Rubidibacter lacunae]|nr:chromophore lyase CpcT/CpeT [Rubidibacter lacunae]
MLASWLAGEFENQVQAREQPAWFVHLRWWNRPLPIAIDGYVALFAEQSPVANPERVYRQRVLVLQPGASKREDCAVQYYACKQPDRWRGGGRERALLAALSPDDLEFLPGCRLAVTYSAGTFQARLPEGTRCQFYVGGTLCEIALGFDVTASEYRSRDKGIDPETGKTIWGGLMGPYLLIRQQSFANELLL